jgi:hypothetical protein
MSSSLKSQSEGVIPLGKSIEMLGGATKNVVAVIQDPAERTSLDYEVILNVKNELFGSTYCNNDDCYLMHNTALLLHPGADTSQVNEKLSGILKSCKYFGEDIILQPYHKIYFDTECRDAHQHANVRFIQLLSVVAVVILLLSIVN